MQHYFVDKQFGENENFWLSDEIFDHLIKVLKSKIGECIELVLPNQTILLSKIIDVDYDNKRVNFLGLKVIDFQVELPIKARIICGIPKGEKINWIVQKATELGVSEVYFVNMERSISNWSKNYAKKIQRLQKIAQSAAEQSHRLLIPKVSYCDSLIDVAKLQTDYKLIAYEETAKQGEHSKLAEIFHSIIDNKNNQIITAVFGPEGGISSDEIKKLSDLGYISVSLGPRILRTETAPLYFLSCLSYYLELFKRK